MRRPLSLLPLAVLAGLAFAAPSTPTLADTIHGPESFRDQWVPIEELSYEVIVEPSSGDTATLRIRSALHNAGQRKEDAALTFAVPHDAQLVGVRSARDGVWTEGRGTEIGASGQPRNPGAVFARRIAAERSGDIPGVEVLAYGLDPGTVTQVELVLEVRPRRRGKHFELDVPRREARMPNFARDRRVLVKGLASGQRYAVDGIESRRGQAIMTGPEDGITLRWPANRRRSSGLAGEYEYMPDASGEGGNMRLTLFLGPTPARQPDHVTFVVDRSKSTASGFQRNGAATIENLLDALPAKTTFDAITFDRNATAVLDAVRNRSRDEDTRKALVRALGRAERAQGTDLRSAFELAGERLARRKASRPMIVVLTDGMVPATLGPDAVNTVLESGLGRSRRPEILFVVDDPVIADRGLDNDHAIAQLAAGLGARISLERLDSLGARIESEHLQDLFAAPRVLGDLDVKLPPRVTLHDDVPRGLVAGNTVVLEGRYEGRAPARVDVRGAFGDQKRTLRLKAKRRPRPPAAFVVDPSAEGEPPEVMSRPTWYSAGMQRQGRAAIAQAGRGGVEQVGALDRHIFARYLRTRVLPRARACFNQALSRNQVQGGHVRMRFEVGKGEVMFAELDKTELAHPDAKFESCLEEAAWALDIPAGKLDRQVYAISYPISFSPPEGGVPPTANEGDDPQFQLLLRSADILADAEKGRKADEKAEEASD